MYVTPNAECGDDGNSSGLRVFHREAGQIVQRVLAFGGPGGRASPLRAHAEMEIALGGKAPAMWNPENPWEALFRKLLKDSDFWAEQVHLPANAWLAHGSKGKLLTPSEAIAENIQGGAAALKAETEAPKGNQEPWKRSANARRRDAKKRKFQEAEDKDTNTKGKGKGKGK